MINIKSISVSAAVGFVLSFLVGLISSNAFLIVLLRAAIFALVFAALAVGISFLYSIFLAEDGAEVSSDGKASSKDSKVGNTVDIVIEDDELEDDDSGPKFFVENNRNGLRTEKTPQEYNEEKSAPSESVVSREEPPAIVATSEEGDKAQVDSKLSPPESQTQSVMDSVPHNDAVVSKGSSDTVSDVSVTNGSSNSNGFTPIKLEDAANISSQQAGQTAKGGEGEIPNVDSLPDIADFSPDKKNEDVGDIISDSDFASSGGKSSGGAVFPDGKAATTQNADVMAQAIRTLLAKDN